ncbi:hypothetical protein ACLB90_17795 [Stenotrophomonas sp. LGBM10]|uniref:hypothetical protein n=1 Tax=Stenotrophomonas sp. LGBM10 TaxID=3390038 RepID=UPI00398A89DB
MLIRAWFADRKPAELAEQQGVGIIADWVLGYLTTDAPEDSRDAIRNAFAEWDGLAATGKQRVGEVQGGARAQFEAWAKSHLPLHRDRWDGYAEHATGVSYAAWYAGWQAALAAHQPGAQVPVATVHVTHGGFGMELATHVAYALPVGTHSLYAAPPAQGSGLGKFKDLVGFALWQAVQLPETDPRRDFIRQANEMLALIDSQRDAAPEAQTPVEMSPDFTDTARAAIAWVLWHHLGGSSPVGKPLRFALGMGSDQHLSQSQIDEAKRFAEWAGATTEGFHRHRPAQAIDLGQVREIRIPARNNLDPISVFVQDQAAGRGRIVVTCYGNAWQAFWGAMGDRTVMEFVAQCDADYVAGDMISGRQTRMTKAERAYTERIAREVIAEFQALIVQRDAALGVTRG